MNNLKFNLSILFLLDIYVVTTFFVIINNATMYIFGVHNILMRPLRLSNVNIVKCLFTVLHSYLKMD